MASYMRYFAAAIIVSLFAQFGYLRCSRDFNHDPRFRKEIEDFAEFMKQKMEKEATSQRNIHHEQPPEASDKVPDQIDHSASNKHGSPESEKFAPLMEDLAHTIPHSEKHLQSSEQEVSSGEFLNSLPSSGAVPSEQHLEKPHHQTEEILFIRRSDSESNNPVADVIDKLFHDDTKRDDIPSVHRRDSEDRSASLAENGPSSDDTCLTDNFTSRLHQMCSDGPEYEMQFHPMFSETLKQDIEKILHEKDRNDNKCDYVKDLTTDSGVEDRALCPFTWTVSNRNPSRIPEDLYEAKCSCQVSRKIRGEKDPFPCIEVKRVIPVLWIVSCGPDGKKKYKQGWEEIAVACAPLEEKASNVVPNKAGTE